MTWHDVRNTIRETASADLRSGRPPGRQRPSRERSGAGAIGRALRRLHEPTTDQPLPQDFAALLQALDTADRRRRA